MARSRQTSVEPPPGTMPSFIADLTELSASSYLVRVRVGVGVGVRVMVRVRVGLRVRGCGTRPSPSWRRCTARRGTCTPVRGDDVGDGGRVRVRVRVRVRAP